MKTWFLSRALREKLLLLALVVATAAIWGSSGSERARAATMAGRATSADLMEQQRWLERREAIQAEADAAVRNLDSARTYNGVRL